MYTVDMILDKKHKCLGSRKVCGIYRITNTKNNKIYIGSSNNICQRWKNHIRELETGQHKNIYLQRDWNEYGKDNFVFEILEQCGINERYTIEQSYLNALLPFYRTGRGYNIAEKSTERNEVNIRFFQPKNSNSNYFIVKAKGCKPHCIDMNHCNNTTKEDLIEECVALDAYLNLQNDWIEQNGSDDWEW